MELIPKAVIEQKIYLIRGEKVMITPDLAELYTVNTSAFMQAVKRNLKRFPHDFMFALSRQEIMNLSQFVISSKIKHAPNIYAFTEQGVAMLSSVLRSDRAILVNIAIMRTFIRLRRVINTNKELAQKLQELEHKVQTHDKDIILIFQAINKLMAPPPPPTEEPKRRIGFHT